jgi:hypothetical protein
LNAWAISQDLWDKVQKTVASISANRMMDGAAKRTYPLSLLLRYPDGSTFAGQGAWSSSDEKHCYYWNRNNNVRISVDCIERRAIEAVQQVIENSREMKAALEARASEKFESLKRIDSEIRNIEPNFEACTEETRKINRRLDFLLEEANGDEAMKFKGEYLSKIEETRIGGLVFN